MFKGHVCGFNGEQGTCYTSYDKEINLINSLMTLTNISGSNYSNKLSKNTHNYQKYTHDYRQLFIDTNVRYL